MMVPMGAQPPVGVSRDCLLLESLIQEEILRKDDSVPCKCLLIEATLTLALSQVKEAQYSGMSIFRVLRIGFSSGKDLRDCMLSSNKMEQTAGVSSTVAADNPPSMALVPVASPALGPVSNQLSVAVRLSFWTCCDNCAMKLEYPLEYQNCSIVCPNCKVPFIAKEVPLGSSKEIIDKPVRRARNKRKLMTQAERECLAGNFQPECYSGVQIEGASAHTQNGGIKLGKGQRESQKFMKPLDADDKVSNDADSQKLLEPQEMQKEAFLKAIIAELMKIPDLPRVDLLSGYDILRLSEFEFMSLMALPMEMRKDWLLMQIAKKNNNFFN
ncbi:hypothetical protein EJB05_49656, partial [Eragrostis curvula]